MVQAGAEGPQKSVLIYDSARIVFRDGGANHCTRELEVKPEVARVREKCFFFGFIRFCGSLAASDGRGPKKPGEAIENIIVQERVISGCV